MNKIPATNRSMFDQSEHKILERGLHTMTVACDALSDQVDLLKKEIQQLIADNSQLKHELARHKELIS